MARHIGMTKALNLFLRTHSVIDPNLPYLPSHSHTRSHVSIYTLSFLRTTWLWTGGIMLPNTNWEGLIAELNGRLTGCAELI